MICLIANGRSGTNALYYNLFKLPEDYTTKEPWKNGKLKNKQKLKEKKRMCRKLNMFHIKPGIHTDLSPKELIDLLLENGVTNFVILKRMNALALLVSDAFLKKKNINKENKCCISKGYFMWAMKAFYKYEDECLEYLKSMDNPNIRFLELIFETDIKNDVQVACEKVKSAFPDIPSSKYIKKPPKQGDLPRHAKNNSLKDKRSLSEKIQNIDEVREYLGEEYQWMLE